MEKNKPTPEVEKLFEQYIGNGQYGIDFEKKHIIEFAEAYHKAETEKLLPSDEEIRSEFKDPFGNEEYERWSYNAAKLIIAMIKDKLK